VAAVAAERRQADVPAQMVAAGEHRRLAARPVPPPPSDESRDQRCPPLGWTAASILAGEIRPDAHGSILAGRGGLVNARSKVIS
jgi:hypothetical protein